MEIVLYKTMYVGSMCTRATKLQLLSPMTQLNTGR